MCEVKESNKVVVVEGFSFVAWASPSKNENTAKELLKLLAAQMPSGILLQHQLSDQVSIAILLQNPQDFPSSSSSLTNSISTFIVEDIPGEWLKGGAFSALEIRTCSSEMSITIWKDPLGGKSLLYSTTSNENSILIATTITAPPQPTSVQGLSWQECVAGSGTSMKFQFVGSSFEISTPKTDYNDGQTLSQWMNLRSNDQMIQPQAQQISIQGIVTENLIKTLISELENSVKRTVFPLISMHKCSKIGVMFSGGLDSTVLVGILLRVLPIEIEIELLNIAFYGGSRATSGPEEAPDRKASRASFSDIEKSFPDRKNLIFKTVDYSNEESQAMLPNILSSAHPSDTYMDVTIGLAEYSCALACQNDGIKVVVLGQGSDEQFGGYARYRGAFQRASWNGLQREMTKDITRLWLRNLGRDDRILHSCNIIPALPYLDRDFCRFLSSLPLWSICDLNLPPGVGDKFLLRKVAELLGLFHCSKLAKRAIQFGTRAAKIFRQEGVSSHQAASCGSVKFRQPSTNDEDDD